MATKLDVGDEVIIPWGLDEVRGTVAELYGSAPRIQVVVELTPELSSYVVDERTTVTLPVAQVRKAGVAA